MTRRRLLELAVLTAGLFVGPLWAHHRPEHHGGPPRRFGDGLYGSGLYGGW